MMAKYLDDFCFLFNLIFMGHELLAFLSVFGLFWPFTSFQICVTKNEENLYNEDDPDLIIEKFWSHVKLPNVSHRIPE